MVPNVLLIIVPDRGRLKAERAWVKGRGTVKVTGFHELRQYMSAHPDLRHQTAYSLLSHSPDPWHSTSFNLSVDTGEIISFKSSLCELLRQFYCGLCTSKAQDVREKLPILKYLICQYLKQLRIAAKTCQSCSIKDSVIV